MPGTVSSSEFKSDLDELIALGAAMSDDIFYRGLDELNEKEAGRFEQVKDSFERDYQNWYTEASALLGQLLPDRLAEFTNLYLPDSQRKALNAQTYRIQDWLVGVRHRGTLDELAVVSHLLDTQVGILRSVERRFESALFDIRTLVQADLFDTELETAKELLNRGFVRAAGAVAGVVLERHLSQVADNHKVKTRKKHPTINDLNDLLKSNSVVDLPSWRHIQRLGDLRNLCAHNKDVEPSSQQVEELIDGVDKFAKTLF
ncbi:MAG: hypothetical protein OXN86_03570 [Chloroflexota bacterium]|nr:hypothetical protein [Chloroflexota bacterium]